MARAAIRQTLEGKARYELELRAIRRDGTPLWIFTNATVIKRGGRVVRMIGATVDITERKRAEEALKDADRRKDEFLAMLSHELRNPLGAITSAAAILQRTPSADATVEMARDIIDRQSGHLTRLVDDLLDLSRITRGKIAVDARRISAADAIALAAETIRPSLEERRQEMIVSLPPLPVEVRADAGRLAQAIGNLLHNASKYSRDGGRIWLSLQREGSDAVVRVRDTGMGIDSELLPRVFDPFVQGAWELEPTLDQSRRGLGLGLSLVRSIVELHGGSVVATSAGPGEGSEFSVRLPALAPQSRDAAPSADRSSAAVRAARRVLIVDDSVDSADGLAKLLEMSGHDVRTSHDGESGLVAAADFRPDVVLLDIGLPGIDGYETARRLRALPDLTGVELVALTGYGREEDRTKAREAGFDRHVVKPIRADALLKLIETPSGRAGKRDSEPGTR
jgi:signal transduction histidine kinase/ActR/RegA family two-component response regulator